MSAAPALDYIPEDLPPERQARLRALAVESEPQFTPVEVSEYLIRHWCETLEDGNPLYLDEEFARSQGLPGLMAPPGSVMTTFALPYRWPWPEGADQPARHIHYDVKELLDLPVGIITKIDLTFHQPLVAGDRVSVSQRLVSISPWKETRLGEGHFWTMERRYRNQHGDVVAVETLTAFGYGRERAAGASGPAAGTGWSPAVEEMLGGGAQPPPEPATRYWEDVREGEELPRLVMPITLTRCAYLASATRDFSPQHSNRDYAQQRSKTKDVFVNTPFNLGMVSRFLTDWAGPRSRVRRIAVAMHGNICAGDDMVLTGRVTRKYSDGGEQLVDLGVTIAANDTPAAACEATLALPSVRVGT